MVEEGISIIVPVKEPEPYYPILRINLECAFEGVPHEILKQSEKGLTNAIVHGVENSKYDIVGVLDADGSHNPYSLLSMYDNLGDRDLIVGSKVLGKDSSPSSRKFVSSFYRLLSKRILNLNITDPMSGIVVARKSLFRRVRATGEYKFVLQLLVNAESIGEYPIYFEKRKAGKSKANPFVGFKILVQMINLKYSYSKLRGGDIQF